MVQSQRFNHFFTLQSMVFKVPMKFKANLGFPLCLPKNVFIYTLPRPIKKIDLIFNQQHCFIMALS